MNLPDTQKQRYSFEKIIPVVEKYLTNEKK